jgi:Uma2 family endonuclease
MGSTLEKRRGYSYNDYCAIDDGNRYEIINGEHFMMSAPSVAHQQVVGELYGQLREKLEGKDYAPFVAPVDVRLDYIDSGDDDIVVQPDVFVVCDKDKIAPKYIKGAPDIVFEVLSESTKGNDTGVKARLYMKYGVKEYYAIDMDSMVIYVYAKKGVTTTLDFRSIEGEMLLCNGVVIDFDRIKTIQ